MQTQKADDFFKEGLAFTKSTGAQPAEIARGAFLRPPFLFLFSTLTSGTLRGAKLIRTRDQLLKENKKTGGGKAAQIERPFSITTAGGTRKAAKVYND